MDGRERVRTSEDGRGVRTGVPHGPSSPRPLLMLPLPLMIFQMLTLGHYRYGAG